MEGLLLRINDVDYLLLIRNYFLVLKIIRITKEDKKEIIRKRWQMKIQDYNTVYVVDALYYFFNDLDIASGQEHQ